MIYNYSFFNLTAMRFFFGACLVFIYAKSIFYCLNIYLFGIVPVDKIDKDSHLHGNDKSDVQPSFLRKQESGMISIIILHI